MTTDYSHTVCPRCGGSEEAYQAGKQLLSDLVDERTAVRQAMGGYPDSDLVSLATTLEGYAQIMDILDDMSQGDNYLAKCLADARKKFRRIRDESDTEQVTKEVKETE